VGFVEALQGLPMSESLRTAGVAVTLAIGIEELRTLLADNTELVRGLFVTLADRVGDSSRHPVQATGAAIKLEKLAQDGLLPVEKILAMQRVPVFSRVSVDEMQHLARIAHEVRMTAGTQLFAQSSPPAVWLLLNGEVHLQDPQDGSRMAAGAGDTIGTLATMSGRSLNLSAQVVRAGLALRMESTDLFQLLGDRPELLRQIFAGMFRMEGTALPGFKL
jgi:CRP-like cAMP-binding protein